jgi:hypothetical protein
MVPTKPPRATRRRPGPGEHPERLPNVVLRPGPCRSERRGRGSQGVPPVRTGLVLDKARARGVGRPNQTARSRTRTIKQPAGRNHPEKFRVPATGPFSAGIEAAGHRTRIRKKLSGLSQAVRPSIAASPASPVPRRCASGAGARVTGAQILDRQRPGYGSDFEKLGAGRMPVLLRQLRGRTRDPLPSASMPRSYGGLRPSRRRCAARRLRERERRAGAPARAMAIRREVLDHPAPVIVVARLVERDALVTRRPSRPRGARHGCSR